MARPTLQETIKAIGLSTGDHSEGITTDTIGSPANQMRDSAQAFGREDDEFISSEVLFLSTPDAATTTNPKQVTDFNGTNGTFTLNSTWSASGVPAGVPYYMLNVGGHGHPYDKRLYAIRMGLEELGRRRRGKVVLDLAPWGAGAFVVTIPEGVLDTVSQVALRLGDTEPNVREETVTPGLWQVIPGTFTLELDQRLSWGGSTPRLAIYGRIAPQVPTTLTGTLPVSLADLLKASIEKLYQFSMNREQAALGGAAYADRQRTEPVYRWPNEVQLGE